MKRKNLVLTAAVLSFGAFATAGQFAQAAPRDRNDRQDVREARKDVKKAKKDVREERREYRNATNPQDRRNERKDVREAQQDLRDAKQDLRREKREDGKGNSYYADRYYRNNKPYTGYYNGYNYNNGYRPSNNNNVYVYNGRYYRNGQIYSGSYGGYYYNNGYRNNGYNNSYNNNYNNGYNNGQNRTFQGVVTSQTSNSFGLRLNNGSTIYVRTQIYQMRNINRNDIVRVSGVLNNNTLNARNVVIVQNRS